MVDLLFFSFNTPRELDKPLTGFFTPDIILSDQGAVDIFIKGTTSNDTNADTTLSKPPVSFKRDKDKVTRGAVRGKWDEADAGGVKTTSNSGTTTKIDGISWLERVVEMNDDGDDDEDDVEDAIFGLRTAMISSQSPRSPTDLFSDDLLSDFSNPLRAQ